LISIPEIIVMYYESMFELNIQQYANIKLSDFCTEIKKYSNEKAKTEVNLSCCSFNFDDKTITYQKQTKKLGRSMKLEST